MNAETSAVLTDLLKIAVTVSAPILIALVKKLATKLEAWIEAQTTNETLKRIEHEAFDTVSAVGQAVADPIKEAAADGKLTDEEKQKIKGIALDKLKSRLGSIPSALLPDLEKRLADAVESAVMRLGIAKSAATPVNLVSPAKEQIEQIAAGLAKVAKVNPLKAPSL